MSWLPFEYLLKLLRLLLLLLLLLRTIFDDYISTNFITFSPPIREKKCSPRVSITPFLSSDKRIYTGAISGRENSFIALLEAFESSVGFEINRV